MHLKCHHSLSKITTEQRHQHSILSVRLTYISVVMLSHINVYVFSGPATNSKRPTFQQSASRRPQVRQHNFLTRACVLRPALICILMWLIANTHMYTHIYLHKPIRTQFDIPTRNLKLPQRCLPEWRLTAQTSPCLLWFLCYFGARTWWGTAIPVMSIRQAPPKHKTHLVI